MVQYSYFARGAILCTTCGMTMWMRWLRFILWRPLPRSVKWKIRILPFSHVGLLMKGWQPTESMLDGEIPGAKMRRGVLGRDVELVDDGDLQKVHLISARPLFQSAPSFGRKARLHRCGPGTERLNSPPSE